MPKPKDPDEGREERERRDRAEQGRQEHGRRGEDDRYPEKDRPRRRRMGREHAVHQQIVERRLSGGAPATPEAYTKAIEEWQQLPGSIVRPPTDEKPSAKDTPEVKNQDAKEE